MNSNVTVQDIADSLHLSRTTVSKVLNGSDTVSEETRNRVLKKAAEMNYKNYNALYLSREPAPIKRIAFLAHMQPDSFHVGSIIMAQLEQEIREKGFSLSIHTITDKDIDSLSLPPNLMLDQVEALVCMEVFHSEYIRFLCSCKKPLILIDACADFYHQDLNCDLIMMENYHSTYRMLTTLIQKHNIKSMGFVGDFNHCLSFRERFSGFTQAAQNAGICPDDYLITDDDSFYKQPGWIENRLQQMKKLPDLFFCANDFLALMIIRTLKEMGVSVPEDLLVCGFDDIYNAIDPTLSRLTTIHTPASALGTGVANLLLQRLDEPELTTGRFTYLSTNVLYRETAPA